MELSQVSYEWNDLEAATRQAQQSLALCRQWGNIDLQTVSYVMLARLEHIQRHSEKTREAIRSAERLMQEHRLLPKHLAWINHARGKLWIERGELEKACRWVEESAITIDDPVIPYLREPDYLVLLRVLLLQGAYDASLRLSERLLHQAEAVQRMGRIIEVLVLQALIYQAKKETDQALVKLEKALSLARTEGYVRTFLDEGEPMAKLLHLAKARRIETDYVTDLLAAAGDVNTQTPPPVHWLNEPLSRREVEVLRLIEAGCSNQEIARKLVISIATVKRHISNMYAKLGAQNRMQAVSIGKELGLFD
jgi:LuxR family maltose regulon positive regulatory protein